MNIDTLTKGLQISEKELIQFTENVKQSCQSKDLKMAKYWKGRATGASSSINFFLKEIEQSLNAKIKGVTYLK